MQAYSQQLYHQMNSFTGIFRQHFKAPPHAPPMYWLKPPHQTLKTPHVLNTCRKPWSSIPKVAKIASLQQLFTISQKKLGMEFILSMWININTSTSWHYCFWWKWTDESITTAFVWYCDAKHFLQGSSYVHCCFWVVVVKNGCLLDYGTHVNNESMKWANFLHADTSYWVGMLKNGGDLLDHGTTKSGVSHKSFHES